jgi:hypothetical protein
VGWSNQIELRNGRLDAQAQMGEWMTAARVWGLRRGKRKWMSIHLVNLYGVRLG